ncbi:MAG: hypothetical protein KKA73_09250 [Chloroflexi bacterium]|nr:hypothetical protein [Chloroflexota bacterium]MBU1747864.1 hypothetical protein [Chloroflexota bacterium]
MGPLRGRRLHHPAMLARVGDVELGAFIGPIRGWPPVVGALRMGYLLALAAEIGLRYRRRRTPGERCGG